jgi:transcriptional repressor NrdR
MHCPFCHTPDTKVIDSRIIAEGEQVKRRRQCLDCTQRFTTFETAEKTMPLIVKRDNRREPFNAQNLRDGMLRSLEKRPVSADDVEKVLSEIIQKILHQGEREVPSRLLGEWVMNELYRLDHIAYVRFASVYKRFESVSEFRRTIEQITENE